MFEPVEWIYRILFGLLWIVYFLVRLYFQSKVKGLGPYVKVNEKQELFFFRLFALAYLLLPVYFLTTWVDGLYLPLHAAVRWAGLFITSAGIVLFAWAHAVLGLNWTAIPALSERHRLVTSGPYRYVRHPMYTAFFVIGFGFFFLSANGFVALVYLGTLSAMYFTRIGTEEKMMIERFGDEYRQYMQTTGKIIPGIK